MRVLLAGAPVVEQRASASDVETPAPDLLEGQS